MPFVSVEALDVTPKLDRRTLADAVCDHLRDRLVAGRLAPGERLSLREISAFVGVSVMPVREAVNRLVAERALEVTANRVLRVPLASPEQIRDLADIRATVEGYAAERAALARNAAQLRTIEDAECSLRTLAENGAQHAAQYGTQHGGSDPGVLIAMNQTLHFAIYEAAGLPLLFKMITDLWLKAGPLLNLDVRSHSQRLTTGVAIECHAAAVTAIRARDGEAARAAIVRDISAAADAHINSHCSLPTI